MTVITKRNFFCAFDTGKHQPDDNQHNVWSCHWTQKAALNHSIHTRPADFNRQFVTIKRLYIVTDRGDKADSAARPTRFVATFRANRFSGIRQSDANTVNDDDVHGLTSKPSTKTFGFFFAVG